MRTWTDEETGIKFCEPDCADEWLADIWAIGCDYDGCNTVEDLKQLVDELVEMAHCARMCLHANKLFGEYGSPNNCDQKCDRKIGVATNSPKPCTSYRDGRCIGTKEIEHCNCHGDQTRCDFYDYIRENAKKAGK